MEIPTEDWRKVFMILITWGHTCVENVIRKENTRSLDSTLGTFMSSKKNCIICCEYTSKFTIQIYINLHGVKFTIQICCVYMKWPAHISQVFLCFQNSSAVHKTRSKSENIGTKEQFLIKIHIWNYEWIYEPRIKWKKSNILKFR